MADEKNDNLLMSYLTLRWLIGVLGLALPFVLVVGGLLVGIEVQPTLSKYYHTDLVAIFAGVQFAIGTFLFTYKGHDSTDNWLANVAGATAIAVAVFPTVEAAKACAAPTGGDWTASVHLIAATVYLLVLAWISYFQFTKGEAAPTLQKLNRNKVYRIAGVVILLSVVAAGLVFLLAEPCIGSLPNPSPVILVLETIAVVAFGVSWFVKGEGIMADHGGDR